MSSSDYAIHVQDVSKHYLMFDQPQDRMKQMIVPKLQRMAFQSPKKYYRDFVALKDISFKVKRGETVGIIGRNGCGKSTLLQIICETLQPSLGQITINGRVAALLELGAGFNPEFTGRENVYMNAAILGLSSSETDARFDEIAKFADIGHFIEQPVKTYSSGMYIRLAFAVAINVDPDILIIDEALSVGDVAFQRKCFARLEQIQERGGTILFVSHSTGSILDLCSRAILLDGGEMLLDGSPKRVTNQYLKLVHMPDEKQEEARQAILELGELPVEEEKVDTSFRESTNQDTQTLEETEGWFDPHLISQSKVEYESKGARIRDVRILSPSGRQVNMLISGQAYTYEYYVDFERNAKDVGFGMLIKTMQGIEIAGGTTSLDVNTRIPSVKPGFVFKITFQFKCSFLPGNYFTNAGVSELTHEGIEYIHRILDEMIFIVMPLTQKMATGIMDLIDDCKVELVS